MPDEIECAPKEIQEHYCRMIRDGQSECWALMCALQQPPGTKGTDRALMQGRYNGNWIDELPAKQAKWLTKEAKAAGISINGKFYMSGLADKRGHLDPDAWIDSVDDIKQVAAKRNLEVTGIVNVKARQEEVKRVDLNPKIARELAKKEMSSHSGLSYKDALERVKEKHTPGWKKNAHKPKKVT